MHEKLFMVSVRVLDGVSAERVFGPVPKRAANALRDQWLRSASGVTVELSECAEKRRGKRGQRG